MTYTWAEFKEAVDSLLIVNADREGTQTVKALWVRQAIIRLQRNIEKYRTGQQNLYTPGASGTLTQNGLASQGSLPEACEPRDCFILRENRRAAGGVDLTDDEITVTAHGITAATGTFDVQRGYFTNSGGALPAGIEEAATYYLRVVDADTLTLHTSSRGVIDNTDRVDITADGTGTTTLVWGQQRFPCSVMPWAQRFSLINGASCLNNQNGLISFDPNGLVFLVYPRLQEVNADGLNEYFELNWDGIKTSWEDTDETPFDEQMTDAVAEFVQAKFSRHVDRDLVAAAAAEMEGKRASAGCYLDARRRTDVKPR